MNNIGIHSTPRRTETPHSTALEDQSTQMHSPPPEKSQRAAEQRVFVNRTVQLEKIKYVGFDMDYTLAVYKSPAYEELSFQLILQRLVDMDRGYPAELLQLLYDHEFPVRGLWFDKQFGNLLKVDAYGNIRVAVHGRSMLKTSEIERLYPGKFVQLSKTRIYVLNTLFDLPVTVVFSSLIAYLEQTPDSRRERGIWMNNGYKFYESICEDVRDAVDHVHTGGDLKRRTVEQMAKFIHKDPSLPAMLWKMRTAGKKTFLLTNSGYDYTRRVMTYLLGDEWKSYFDCIIVDSRKPKWFGEDTKFQRVNEQTGALESGTHTGPLGTGHIYAGGSCQVFSDLLGIRGEEVLYVGDHIFGDVLRSKKGRGWRTCLVIPELTKEMRVWAGQRSLLAELGSLKTELAELYAKMDIKSREQSEEIVTNLRKRLRHVAQRLDQEYGIMGSMFRCRSRETFFASQAERYADLYAGSCCNLVHYPLSSHQFRAEPRLMPHENAAEDECADHFEE